MKKKKFNLSGAFAFILAVLILLIFVPINMIFSYYDKIFDMTPTGRYTIDPVTVEILEKNADKDVDIYFLSQLVDLQNVPRYLPLYHTLTELDKRDNVTLHCIDPNAETELMSSLNPDGRFDIGLADILVKSGDNVRHIPFGHLFQRDSNDIIEYCGENLIAGAIHVCTTGELPVIYFLEGYGENTLENSYRDYANYVKGNNYEVESLDLSTVDSVPKDTAIVYLAAPQQDISMDDRQKLSEYIDNGGAISMYLPPCETEGRFENIEYLLAKFELAMDYNIVKETNEDYMYKNPNVEDDGTKYDGNYFMVSYPYPAEDSTEDLTTDLNGQILKGVLSAGISHPRSFYELSSSSEMIEKNTIIENMPLNEEATDFSTESFAMGGDDITAAQAKDKTKSPLAFGYYSYNKQTGAKLIAIGADDFLDNSRTTEKLSGSRMLATFSNTWLYDTDTDMGIAKKSNTYDTMVFEDGNEASRTIRLFFIIPAVFALAGVAVWLKRRYA